MTTLRLSVVGIPVEEERKVNRTLEFEGPAGSTRTNNPLSKSDGACNESLLKSL